MKHRVVFMGTPEFSVPILEMLIENYDVILVVTKPDTKVGRKQILTPSPVKECALKHGIEVFQPESIKNDYLPVLELDPDIIITAAFGEFIPQELIVYPKYGCINVHGSLLPELRGGSPVQSSIIRGFKETGITIMYMEKKMDAGDIISQAKINIDLEDTNSTLFQKLSLLGRDLLRETLPSIFAGTNKRIKQKEEEATFAYNIKPEEQIIDFNDTSLNIYNKIRGLAEEPGAMFYVGDICVKVYKSKIVSYEGNELPGTILKVNKELWIKTQDGAISILDILQSGKKRMDIKSYLNGQKLFVLGCSL